MSDAKKYYWLKLKDDFFTQPKIKKLRRIAGGDTYTIIYLKMQLLSLKNNGVLTFQKIEPSFAEELALIIDEDEDNVNVTLQYLVSQGLIESNDADFLLTEAAKSIGTESKAAERVRRFREKDKAEALQCNADVTQCNADVTARNVVETKCNTEIRDKREEIRDRDKRVEIEGVIGGDPQPPAPRKATVLNELISAYTDNVELRECLLEFVKQRKIAKKPLTEKALELNLTKLSNLAGDDEGKIAVINQSIERGWQGLFAVKQEYERPQYRDSSADALKEAIDAVRGQ